MSSKQQQREYARRRYEKWLARQQEIKARRRKRAIIIGSVLGALLLAGVVWLVFMATGDDEPAAPEQPVVTDTDTAAPEDGTSDPEGATEDEPRFGTVPDPAIAEGRAWTARLSTTLGDIVLELNGAEAPQAVASFIALARDEFFDDTTCHRLTTQGIFVLQCGDPLGNGKGGPDYRFGPIENAPADDFYPAGTLAMARVGNDASSMGSQFFLVYEDSTIPSDPVGGYTVFGRVLDGMDVLEEVAAAGVVQGTEQPVTAVTIQSVEVE